MQQRAARFQMGTLVQKLTVHNRRSIGWASPPDLTFLKGFTWQTPAGFSGKSVTSRKDVTLTHRNFKEGKELAY